MTKQRAAIESALYCIPAHNRDIWLAVGAALKTEFGEAGFALFDQWSRTSPKQYRVAHQRSQWRSFKRHVFTAGTIFHLAREHGWQGTAIAGSRPTAVVRREITQREQQDRELGRRVAKRADAMIKMSEWSTHPYLQRKGFPAEEGFCYTGEVHKRDQKETFPVRNRLVVPVLNAQRKVQSLQLIAEDGSKMFLPGGLMHGGRYVLGREKEVWICEGWATALSLRAALTALYRKHSIWVSFMASNIVNLAKPGHLVVVDHDKPPTGERYGAGEKYGRKSGCRWWQPKELGDLNDMHQLYGLDYVKKELRLFLQGE